MAAGNEKAAVSVKNKPNGQINGHTVGHVSTPKNRSKPCKSWSHWSINTIARLTIYYALFTIVFRCPSNAQNLQDITPAICKPYLKTRTYAQPYIQPYYDSYAASYVEKAKPYVNRANTLVIGPASKVVVRNYDTYAAPQIKKIQSSIKTEWDRMMLPSFLLAQERATELYTSNLAPHVDKAASIAVPYYEAARDNAVIVHQQHILPTLESSKPHLVSAYRTSQEFVIKTALPHLQAGWFRFIVLVDGTLWPLIKGLYSDNVKPQLVMISERIASYQESRKLRAIVDEAEISMTSATSSVDPSSSEILTASPTSNFIESMTSVMSSIVEEISSTVMPSPAREVEVATEESITEDLVKWQKKFALAADRGTDDLRQRIEDIIQSFIKNDIGKEGKGLKSALEKSIDLEIQNVKTNIQKIIEQMPDEQDEAENQKADENVMLKLRESGMQIRERATMLRSWAQRVKRDITHRTALAAEGTLQVLDSIRDLGLQEIGMRWAWMDGVTYKHWAKYHDLKQRFDEWREEVQSVATKTPAVEQAKELAQSVLEEGMAITEDAAHELIRLKEVARWKIRARDTTEKFESRIIPAAAVSAASKVAEEISELASTIIGSTQGSIESLVSKATESTDGLSSTVLASMSSAGAVVGSQMSSASSLLHSQIPHVDSVLSKASTLVVGTSTGTIESLISNVASSASSTMQEASSVIIGTSPGAVGHAMSSIAGAVEDKYTSASAIAEEATQSASAAMKPVTPDLVDELSAVQDSVDDMSSSASRSVISAATAVSSRVFAGAMAQEVKGQIPILDDVFDDATKDGIVENLQSVASEASDKYADLTKALSEAIYGTSQGTVESLTSVASEQYQSALSAASLVLYGKPTPTAEILASAARARYEKAVAAASSVVYSSRQTAVAESLLQQAKSAYSSAVNQAQEYRQAAEEVISKQIAATSKPIHAQMLESISSAYDGSVAIASAKLDEVLNAASKQYSSVAKAASAAIPTQNKMESVSSVASSRLQEALAIASSQYHSAMVAVGAEPTPATLQAQQAYYAALGYAHEQYGKFITAGSSVIYGTPTPAYQSLLAKASSQYAVVAAAASSSLDSYLSSMSSIASQATKTQSPAQNLISEASASYHSVLSVASASLVSASASASAVLFGAKQPVYQSALGVASSQYAVATAFAVANMKELLDTASKAIGKTEKSPAQSVLDSISSQYNDAMAAASSSLLAASTAASIAVYGTPAPAYKSALDAITSQYSSASNVAAANMNDLLSSAKAAVGKKQKSPAQSLLDSISSQYNIAIEAASSSMAVATSSASVAFYGPPEGSVESIASVASANWEALVAAASSNIYGAPTPVWASVTSQAGELTAQATEAAAEKYAIIAAYVSELVIGKEPDFTESVMSRLSYVYHTGVVASAASMANEAYASGASVISSVSSVASAYFSTPPEVDSILAQVNLQLSAAIEAASVQVYGAKKGPIEKATSAAVDAYSAASSAASEAIYGTPIGYGEAASKTIADAALSASNAISLAIFGTPTGTIESAASVVGDTYSSISAAVSASLSSAADQAYTVAGSVQAKVSAAVLGPEHTALESAQARILEAVESARSRLAAFSAEASATVGAAASVVSESVGSLASEVSKSVSSVSSRVKDEL